MWLMSTICKYVNEFREMMNVTFMNGVTSEEVQECDIWKILKQKFVLYMKFKLILATCI